MAAQRLVGDGILIAGGIQLAGDFQLHGGFLRQDGLGVFPALLLSGNHLEIGGGQGRIGHHIDADLIRCFPHAGYRGKLTEEDVCLHIAAIYRDAQQLHPGAAGAVLGAVADEIIVIGIGGEGAVHNLHNAFGIENVHCDRALPVGVVHRGGGRDGYRLVYLGRFRNRAVDRDFRRKVGAPGCLANPHGRRNNLLSILLVDHDEEVIPVGAVKGFVDFQQVGTHIVPLLDDLPLVGVNRYIVDPIFGVRIIELGIHLKLGGIPGQDGPHKFVVCREDQFKIRVQGRIGGALPEGFVQSLSGLGIGPDTGARRSVAPGGAVLIAVPGGADMPPGIQAVLEGGQIAGHLVLEQFQLGVRLFGVVAEGPEIAFAGGVRVVKLGDGFRILGEPCVKGGQVVFHVPAAHAVPAVLGKGGELPGGIIQVHMPGLIIPGDFLAGDGDEFPVLVISIRRFVQETPIVGQGVVDVRQIVVPVADVQQDIVIGHAEEIQGGGFPDMLVRVLRQLYPVTQGGVGMDLPGVELPPHIGDIPAAVGEVSRLCEGLKRQQGCQLNSGQESGGCPFDGFIHGIVPPFS